jgi:hypothetical protein
MTDLPQNNRPTAEDGMQPTSILVQGEDNPTITTDFSTPAVTEPSDAPGAPAPPGLADQTMAGSQVDNVGSDPAENVFGATTVASDVRTAGIPLPAPTTLDDEISQLNTELKRILCRRTLLPDSVSALVAFWAISTWFQEAFTVFPCLVITGPAHEAMVVLRVLNELCYAPILLAGFKRSDLKDINRYRTLLISEQNLDARTAALLGNLTNRGFALVDQGYYLYCANSKAVYIGDDPAIKPVQHSIYIDATVPARTDGRVPGQPTPETIDAIRNRILEYRSRNLEKVRLLEFNPAGLSLEATAIANALGSCIVESPQLQMELVALLRPQAQQQIADRSDGDEALIVGAALALSHQDKDEVFVKEISIEVNRLLVARGETRQLSPEKVGHKLKRMGMFTRRLSHAGNGMTLDQATRVRLHEVAAAYRGEDSLWED